MAGSRIKGITIEIDGNTTKLQKALSGVDKSLQGTQAKLQDVNKLLKLDPKNTELLTQKQKALEDAIGLTKQRLEELKKAQEGVEKGSAEWDALQREIVASEQSLEGLEKEYKEFGSVSMQQIASAGKDMQELGGKISAVGEKLVPLSTAAAGVVAGMGALAYKSVTAADDLNTLSKQTGISTTALQKMQYASDLVDVSVEDITGAITKMKKAMGGTGEGFEAIGVSITNADGSMRDAEDVFYDTLEALSQIENETERDQAAYEIFGKSADQLAGIVDDGGAALKAYGDEAESLGLIMSGDTLDSLNAINDTIDQSKATVGAAAIELGATIAEGIAPMIETVAEGIRKVTEFLQGLTPEQTNLIMGIAAAIAVLAPLLIAIGNIITVIGTVMTLLPVITAALTPPVLAVIAVGAAVAALAVLIYTHWDEIKTWTKQLAENIKKRFEQLKTNMIKLWNTIKTAISNRVNAMKEAVENALQSIRDFFTNMKNSVSNTLTALKSAISGRIAAIKNFFLGLQTSISSRIEAIKTKFTDMKNNIINVASDIFTNASAKFNAIKTAITSPIESAKLLVGNAINYIKGLFSGAKFSFPHIKLPHFSWYWRSIGGLVNIPQITIDWYKKAYNNPYLFNSPTVMQTSAGLKGFGDGNGGELVYGRDQLMRDIAQASAGEVSYTVNVYAPNGMDVNVLAQKVQDKFAQWEKQRISAYA